MAEDGGLVSSDGEEEEAVEESPKSKNVEEIEGRRVAQEIVDEIL